MKRVRSGGTKRCAFPVKTAVGCVVIAVTYLPVSHGFEMDFTGRATVALRDIDTEEGSDSQQQVVTGNLTGLGYLWRPWFARASLRLDLSQIENEQESDVLGASKSRDDILSGEGRVNLFHRSRFPTDLFAEVTDSRVETSDPLTVGDINTLRRERYGVTQQYRPPTGGARYAFQYVHDDVVENDGDNEESDEWWVTGGHSVADNSVDYQLRQRDADIFAGGERRDETQQTFNLRHGYHPRGGFSLENAFDRSLDEEVRDGVLTSDLNTSLTSHLSWRPAGSRFSARANLNLLRRENENAVSDSTADTALLSLGFNYDIADSFRVSGDAGASRSRNEGRETDRHFETLALAYDPESIALGSWQYFWGVSTSIGNSGQRDEEDVQSVSAGLRHGVSRLITGASGSVLSVGLSQSISRREDTEGERSQSLTHLATISGTRNREGSIGRLQLSVSDSRTSGLETSDGDVPEDFTDAVQTVSLLGSVNHRTGRHSNWSADVTLGETRVKSDDQEDQFSFGLLSGGYTNNRWLGVRLLRFQSRLEYSVRQSIPDDEGKSDESRAVWDNRINYTIGLLELGARLTITDVDDDLTRTLVVSASRYFF